MLCSVTWKGWMPISDILLWQGNQKSTYPQLGSWALLGKCLQANTMNWAHIPRRHIKFQVLWFLLITSALGERDHETGLDLKPIGHSAQANWWRSFSVKDPDSKIKVNSHGEKMSNTSLYPLHTHTYLYTHHTYNHYAHIYANIVINWNYNHS